MTMVTSLSDSISRSRSGSAAERTLRLLLYLVERRQAVTLAELSEAHDLPKPTAHRMCALLLEMGFIARAPDEKSFAVGPTLRKLAFDTLNHNTLSGLRHKVLADLVEQIGETCNFTTIDGATVLYVDRVESNQPWRLTLNVGAHVPMHCTASGKLFLATMPSQRRNYLLQRLQLERLTKSTLTSIEELRASFDTIVSQGYSIECEEFVVGLIALAVPVRGPDGSVRAAIAMHAPLTHVSPDEVMKKLPSLQATAKCMEQLLY